MSLLSAVLILSLAEPAPIAAPADTTSKGEKYALLVGVQKYSEAKELRPLPYSERDVTDLAQVLRDSGYNADNIVLMTQTAAEDDLRYLPMKQRILKELRLLLADRREDDTVLLAFAGHGVHFSGDKNSYFCPADAQLDERSSLLALPDLYAELEKCKAGVKVLLVDACRNDPFKDNTRAAKMDLESVTRPEVPEPPTGVVAFFSCSEKEKAYEDEDLHHGVFFHFVIEGLKGEAAPDKGEVTLLALSEYVTRKVGDHVRAAYGKTQKPELMGRNSGSAALVRLDEAALHVRKGQMLLERDRYDDAMEEFTQAIRVDSSCAVAYAERALIFALRRQWDKALEDTQHAVEADPRCALAYAVGGMARSKKSEYDKALEDCNEAVRLDPGLLLAYTYRAKVYADEGDFDAALSDCARALRLDPKSAAAYSARGYVYDDKKEYDRAIADYTEAIRLDPKFAGGFYNRGNAYVNKGAYDDAIADYTEAIRIDPKFADAYYNRGNAYSNKGANGDAIANFTEAIQLNPKCLGAYANRGKVYFHKGDYDAAIADFTEVIGINPKFAQAYADRGASWYQKGVYTQAIADCTEAIRIDPKYANAYQVRGKAYKALGYKDKAEADYEISRRLEK